MQPLAKLDIGGSRGDAALRRSVKVLQELAEALASAAEALQSTDAPSVERGIDFYDEVRRFEVALIERALRLSNWRQRRAAQLLGLKVTTLNAKIKLYGIKGRPREVFMENFGRGPRLTHDGIID